MSGLKTWMDSRDSVCMFVWMYCAVHTMYTCNLLNCGGKGGTRPEVEFNMLLSISGMNCVRFLYLFSHDNTVLLSHAPQRYGDGGREG